MHILDKISFTPLFSNLTAEQLEIVKKSSYEIKKEDTQFIFNKGEVASHFYFLISGEIKLFNLSIDGVEKIIEIVKPNHFFAEATVFLSPPRYPANATATCNSKLIAIDSNIFLNILKESNSTCIKLLGNICLRLHQKVNEINDLTLKNATYRLAHFLVQLSEEHKCIHNNEQHIHLPSSKKLIASRLAIQPETFSRILSKLSRKNLIEVHYQDITLKDVQGLKNLLN